MNESGRIERIAELLEKRGREVFGPRIQRIDIELARLGYHDRGEMKAFRSGTKKLKAVPAPKEQT